jgi:hypothetical protein
MSSRHRTLARTALLVAFGGGALHAQVTSRAAKAAEILGLETWTKEKFSKEAMEHCKGRW